MAIAGLHLTAQEQPVLETMAQHLGKTPDELVHDAVKQLIAQFHLHRSGPRRQPPAVIAGPAQTGHPAEPIHGLAFLPRLTDFFKQTSAPLTTAGG